MVAKSSLRKSLKSSRVRKNLIILVEGNYSSKGGWTINAMSLNKVETDFGFYDKLGFSFIFYLFIYFLIHTSFLLSVSADWTFPDTPSFYISADFQQAWGEMSLFRERKNRKFIMQKCFQIVVSSTTFLVIFPVMWYILGFLQNTHTHTSC